MSESSTGATDETTTADASGITDGGSCDTSDGAVDICWDESNYATCVNGQWVVRACASGTVCQDNDGSVTCGWANDAD
ncbi:hypothetical protein ACFXHA_11960 [Nocardia sp. NPDC059240]|uniref:hypothetical protein n=1 Tax=Nocardia sp. NPDC059240 TaxID=3346786 RepID=UPI003681FCD7